MTRYFFRSLVLLILFSLGAGPALGADGELPLLPPLTQPAADTRLPGKFIWADLVTSEFEAARQFYAETFGWEWRWINRNPEHLYGMFYNDGRAARKIKPAFPDHVR